MQIKTTMVKKKKKNYSGVSITSHQSEQSSSKKLQTINAGEDMEEREPYRTVGGTANWYGHYGAQYGDSLTTQE